MGDLNVIPDEDGQADQVRQLDATQKEVTSPDYAKQAGLLKPTPQPTQDASWGALVKDHPVLANKLTDPEFAHAAKEDVPQLSAMEKIFGGWDEMAWKSKLALSDDARNQELAAIGRAMRNGTATPQQLKRGEDLDKEAESAGPGPNTGFVPGIVPAVVGAAPGMARALPTAVAYGALGGIGAALLTKNPKATTAAAGAMAGWGFTVGMAADTAKTEQGLAYREYIKAGADPQTAGVAADIVALANGGLQAIPAEKILNLAPGLAKMFAGKETRDLMRRLITSNTGKAAIARLAGRTAESGLIMGLVSSSQELIKELGAIGAGAKEQDEKGNTVPASLHAGRIRDAGVSGIQQGVGFGLGHAIPGFVSDKREAQLGLARQEAFKAIGGIATNSKLRENMPEAFKRYVNDVVSEHGNVNEVTVPAEKLTDLLQKEGIGQEKLEADMPNVAKQLKTAKGTDEITIPTGDLATHLAALKSFPALTEDIRIGDGLTAREAKTVQAEAAKRLADAPAPAGEEEPDGAAKVYNDIHDQLTRAGQAPEVAQHDAALWAAFAKSRGERLGMDPFDYYKQRAVSVGAEFPDVGGTTLGQTDKTTIGAEIEQARQLREHADKIEEFGEDLKKVLRSGADVPDDQLTQFLANEKQRKEGRVPTEAEIDEAIKRAKEFHLNSLEQAAYHGTPHDFDKFTLDHIGSGEGNQAYGWGLYFAESKKVAEWYKKVLTAGRDRDLLVDGKPANTMTAKSYGELDAISTLREFMHDNSALHGWTHTDGGAVPDLQSFVDSQIKERKQALKEAKESTVPESIFKDTREQRERSIKHDEDFIATMEELRHKKLDLAKVGKIHEVEVPEKQDLLDYDKPLNSNPEILEKLKKAGLIDPPQKPKEMLEAFLKTDFAKSFSDGSEVRIVKRLLADGDEEEIKQFVERKLKDPSAAITNTILADKGGTFYERLSKKLGGSKEASIALKEAGIPGLKYLDQGSRAWDSPEGTHNFVIWDENAIKILNTLEQKGGAAGSEGYRGKISFDDARSFFNITLTGKANLSTFLHESGHAFFEFLTKDAESGHAGSIEDLNKLREWMGTKAGEKPSVEHLEAFARGFENYLMEGKAPSPELRPTFRTFANWLKQVYRSFKSLNVNLTDEVRGVMDRMLASDKEIEKAKAGLGLEPMKKPEGMSDSEFTAYTDRFGKAMEASRNELEEQALREFRNTIGEERSKVRKEVEDATKQDPAHNAYEALRTGKRLDGAEVPEEIAGKKLDRESVKEAGHSGIKWSSITSEDGLDPETAAPYYGYKSGPEMLDALEARRSRTAEIKDETDRRMADKYPNADLANMSANAVKALHLKDDVGNVLWLEAKAMSKQIGKEDPRTAKAVVKEMARRRVEEMTQREMQPGKFARAEERAAGEWADAMRKKDFEAAHTAKLEQIMSHEMFKHVSEAKEEVDGIRSYLDKFNELPARRKLGKAGQSYLSAVDAIVKDVDLNRETNKTLDRRASLESYLREMENEDGALITIPAELRSEAGFKNYREMTLEELRTVRDAVKNIESMARLKNKLFDGRESRNFHATAIKLAENIKANRGAPYAEKPNAPQNPGWWDQKKASFRESRAEKKKIEFVMRELDGGETAGMAHELGFQPLADADERKMALNKKITQELLRPLREMTMKERFEMDKTIDFLGTPMKVRDAIAVALNMGNEGNKKKLIDGYGYRGGWTEERITQRLGEVLTDKHLDLVQHFWNTIGSMWPEIKALSERATGVSPPKVEASKLGIRGRELEGGYYPVVYDRDRSYKAEQIAQRKGDLFENNFMKPGVDKGFTEARTQFAAPIKLSLSVIPAHINEVIHYLTHYEPITAVDRLMNHKAVRAAVTEGLGRETYNLFRPWLQAIARDGAVNENTTTIDNALRHLRVGASVTRLGFRLTNSLMQGFNVLSTVKELGGVIDGPKYLALGMKTWMGELNSMRDPFGPIMNEETGSPEIRGKAEKVEHNLIGQFDEFSSAFSAFGTYKNKLAHFSLSFMALAWKSVEAMTWYGAREKAFAEGHPRPAEYADSVTRMAQMGEGMKDKAAIMRGGEGTKIFTYMYSWYSTIFNQLTEAQPQSRGNWKKAGELASRYWWMVLAPTVLMHLARGKKPEDGQTDAESIAGDVALETAKSYTGPIGGIVADTMLSGHDAKFAPWISTVLRGLAIRGKIAANLAHGEGTELSDHEKKDLFESTGIVSHLPAGAMYNAQKYVAAIQDGKLEEPIQDLLFRSPGDWK